MNVLQNLIELYNTLPADSTYRGVARGILTHLDEMQDVTIYDIAEITSSSRTTVWRMVQKMGYSSFSNFRYALQAAVTQYNYYNRILPAEALKSEEKILETAEAQLSLAAENLKAHVTPELLGGLASALGDAGRVDFYMPFRLSGISSLQQNLAMDGKETGWFALYPEMLAASETAGPDCVAMISTIEFAETLNMTEVFKNLRKNGAAVWLAGSSRTRYRKYADRVILDSEDMPLCWLTMMEGFLIALSEEYRALHLEY